MASNRRISKNSNHTLPANMKNITIAKRTEESNLHNNIKEMKLTTFEQC